MARPTWLALGVVLVAGSALAGVAVTGAATAPVLVVTDDEGTELLAVPVEEDATVTVEYTHSVERTLVSDEYVVAEGALVTDRMLFSSYGAGLPSTAPVTRAGDRYVHHPPPRRHDPLVVSTGPVADHDLVVGGQRYDLAGTADGGTVSLHVESRSRIGGWSG